MKRLVRSTSGLVALFGLLVGVGCLPPQGSAPENEPRNAPQTAPQTAPQPPAAAPAPTQTALLDPGSLPVTLPVLDALLYDTSFQRDLASRLHLTDQEIDSVRKIAHDAAEKLREGDTEEQENPGSTAESVRDAETRITAAIGEEKARKLFDLAREYWSGKPVEAPGETGGAATESGTPEAVPSDTRIVINAPAYRMDVFEDGTLAKSYKVGIGYPEFPLPTGLRKAQEIIFNPSWTPPDEPWVRGSRSVKAGEKIEPGDKRNPLGPIKIPIGLPSLIHGGKSLAKIGGFASHGCVGLTTPQVEEFTGILARLGGLSLTNAQMAEYKRDKTHTRSVKLTRPVPVELRYETITVEDGKLHVYRDVYERNTNNEENLRAVLATYGVAMEQLTETERAKALDALREMSRTARGAPLNTASNAGGGSTSNRNDNTSAGGKKAPGAATSGKVTQSVKGRKEVVVEIAALLGKGYPSPVALNSGGAQARARVPADKTKKKGR